MSLFSNIFRNSDSKDTPSASIVWNDLTDIQQLDAIATESAETPVIIFKHSTRCSVSRMALKNFEREYAIDIDTAKPYFLDLLEHRDISNEIASRFGVVHQSPQLILIKNGEAVYTTSHSDIDAAEVKGRV
ncbi:bacillithiol system redox-active protein YtxJ [Flavobacterium zepuense]|uniref:Bacillithiol system redox-active protein YtxJ n=1 Tax=Flavobacterium zepuense TaxID=2593302 RepID=A0A552UYY2_9FLAO|nr:bacillithiol system redox-active protein YtxJ [Flavobacterium zepuense]TRW23411.1 bacillithiol system redox-active protein YtxJ [Flavobacterium zepuense]